MPEGAGPYLSPVGTSKLILWGVSMQLTCFFTKVEDLEYLWVAGLNLVDWKEGGGPLRALGPHGIGSQALLTTEKAGEEPGQIC